MVRGPTTTDHKPLPPRQPHPSLTHILYNNNINHQQQAALSCLLDGRTLDGELAPWGIVTLEDIIEEILQVCLSLFVG
jgi:hypothetical protein